jgi:hypothetical protein
VQALALVQQARALRVLARQQAQLLLEPEPGPP